MVQSHESISTTFPEVTGEVNSGVAVPTTNFAYEGGWLACRCHPFLSISSYLVKWTESFLHQSSVSSLLVLPMPDSLRSLLQRSLDRKRSLLTWHFPTACSLYNSYFLEWLEVPRVWSLMILIIFPFYGLLCHLLTYFRIQAPYMKNLGILL